MEIVTLKVGDPAPSDSDCISITDLPDGKFALTGSVLADDTSVAMVNGPKYDSVDAAMSEGLAWASSNNVERLYVARSNALEALLIKD